MTLLTIVNIEHGQEGSRLKPAIVPIEGAVLFKLPYGGVGWM
jgi:hypothetical protein